MGPWAQFWRELNTQDDFEDDPYTEGANQVTHWCGGALLACIVSVLWFQTFGEYPARSIVGALIIVPYGTVIEMRQRERPGAVRGKSPISTGSMIDTTFVALGAALPLLTFTEVEAGQAGLVPNWSAFWAVLFASASLLFIRVNQRVQAKYG